jgi:hypothetical protein
MKGPGPLGRRVARKYAYRKTNGELRRVLRLLGLEDPRPRVWRPYPPVRRRKASSLAVKDALTDLTPDAGRMPSSTLRDEDDAPVRRRPSLTRSSVASATVSAFAVAAATAQAMLTRVVVPENALRDLDDLDAAVEAQSWGASSWSSRSMSTAATPSRSRSTTAKDIGHV